jgi:tetratricopeptide (TPR) repeat protein
MLNALKDLVRFKKRPSSDDPIAERRHQALAQLAQGERFESQGDIASAIAAYEHAINLCPDLVRPFHRIGILKVQSKEWLAAGAMFLRVTELTPTDPAAYFNLSTCMVHLDRPRDVENLCRVAVLLDPSYAIARVRLREFEFVRHENEHVMAALEAAIGEEAEIIRNQDLKIFIYDELIT